MTLGVELDYHRSVAAVRLRARHWFAAGVLALIAVLGIPWAAAAATAQYPVADQAVIALSARWANVTIRTWSRSVVQVEFSDDSAVSTERLSLQTGDRLFIRAVSDEEKISPTEHLMATLLPEDFPLPRVAQIRHDAVRVTQLPQAQPAARATRINLMIPETTAMLNLHLGHGSITVHDYHGTTSAVLHNGLVVFDGVGGDAFVQPLNGRFYAVDSSFDFLRIRSNGADEVFDGCRVREIEATTLTGNILYDNGTFDPGLARFESDRGSIALGINGGAQLGAHAAGGRVVSALPTPPELPVIGAQPDFDRTRVVGEGGPLVNALSANGDVFLYRGSLGDRNGNQLGAEWQPMRALLTTNRRLARHALHAAPPDRFAGRQ